MSNYIGKVFSSSPSSILVAVNAGVMGTVPADTRTRPVMSTEPMAGFYRTDKKPG